MIWVLPLLVRKIIRGWYGSFVGKKLKKVWKNLPSVSFRLFGRKEIGLHSIMRSFDSNDEFFLVFCDWSWTKLIIDKGPLSFIKLFFF